MNISELVYDKESGDISWISSKRGVKKGVAGCLAKTGYTLIRLNNKLHLAHRLAYYMVTGAFPEHQIDHIDGNRSNNRWNNLRSVTSAQNSCNRKYEGTPLGVYEITRKGRKGLWYRAVIQKDRKTYSTSFRKQEDAIAWRLKRERELFGEYQHKTSQ